MKCFHFTNGERKEEDDEDGVVSSSRSSKVSWARSLSVASSSVESTRRSEFDSDSRDFTDSLCFYQLLAQRRGNDLRVFTFAELKSATRGFSRALVIGEGGFGCVYRGVVSVPGPDLNSNVDVAVKQLNRNEDDERGIQRLLVYELMHNKSLEDHLFSRSPNVLSWSLRLRIAQDAARGLAYLHEEMDFQLIFRDFKSSNILLDEDFNAKLSDFGLARQGPAQGLGHVSTAVVGTVGYAAPEYVHTGRLTAKSDVWSFGVVLYELITGRRVLERNLPRGEQKLLEWVRPYVSDSKKFHIILDPRLEGQNCTKSALRLASLANKCLMKQPKSRPKMSEVVERLSSIITETTGDEAVPDTLKSEGEAAKDAEEEDECEEAEPEVQENNNQKKGFDFREIINLRNKSIGKLDWRNWTPGLVRTR
nr:probable receptor-like protein kinase At5g47070 [Ipomoea batatas]